MKMPLNFHHLTDEGELCRAFALMQKLRPQLTDSHTFAAQIARQLQQHYRLLGAWRDDQLVGLIGYRQLENLLYGRFIYVDDLVVAEAQRHQQIGAKLLDNVRQIAQAEGCKHLVLDTGLHMPLAQRFYFREGLLAKGMHFVQLLPSEEMPHG